VWLVANGKPVVDIPGRFFGFAQHVKEEEAKARFRAWFSDVFLPAVEQICESPSHPLLPITGWYMVKFLNCDILLSAQQLKDVFIDGPFLERLARDSPQVFAVAPTWCHISVDPWGAGYQAVTTLFNLVSSMQARALSDKNPMLFTDFCLRCLSTGAVDMALAGARSFELVEPAASAGVPVTACCYTILQMVALGEGCAKRLLEHAAGIGCPPAALSAMLMDGVRRGGAVPAAYGMS
jgi:hypothetical protein